MLFVSDGWKNAHGETILPETFIEINFRITEPGLPEAAVISANHMESFSDAPKVRGDVGQKYTTLEWNAWGLDGTFDYFDGSPTNPGYVTDVICDENAAYSVAPAITLSFDSVRKGPIPGVTICWSDSFDEWASSFRITVYNGSNVVAQTTVENNTSHVSTVWIEYQNFDKVVVEILEWCLPYRRCRTMCVFLGIEATYRKKNLLGFSHSQRVDLLSASLPKNELSFQLDNSDDKWNPDNPSGVEKYLTERQKLTLRYGMIVDGATEWLDAGTFWLSEWNTPTNGLAADFVARDAVQFMEDVYTGIKSGTLYVIAEAALKQISIDGNAVEYVIDNSLKSITTDFSDSTEQYTVSNVLQMVAHMGCCVFYSDANGAVHIEPLSEELTDFEILPLISYTHPEFNISKPLKAVSVEYGEQAVVVEVGANGEVQTVSNDFITTSAAATRVANAAIKVLKNRKTISGEYRADPRLEALDVITVHNKYATNKVVVTDVLVSTTGGGLRGVYEGRVIDDG